MISQCPDDELSKAASAVLDRAALKSMLLGATYARFEEALVCGAPTSEEDMKAIAEAVFAWARKLGAVAFAHWFFPMRGGGGAVGGAIGAYKMDTLIDLDWSSAECSKPFHATLPYERLFFGETDGSSFPNGGLRATHTAAAFTTWDRSSPCFVIDKVLRIPCSFVTHLGACIDEKTPLLRLRSNDALNREGMRLLKAIDIGTDAKAIHSFLGWEQEFFVIKAAHYQARPDLMNCGRTLVGNLPPRHRSGDLNYFAPVANSVSTLLFKVQAKMLELGVPMAVIHNEVAPAQHEMSPIYCQATFASDSNVLFMEVCTKEAERLGLSVIFHEKPFAGINGSGKHSNWSVGTDTGLNFFYPGKSDVARQLFVTSVACLSYGLKHHSELVCCSVACAGNDHRLGAQEAPPAIISLYPGTGFEEHVDSIIGGGPLLGYKAEKKLADPKASAAQGAPCGVEDRNRTAPFPFCGNRFEFRAVGSSQNCSFPIAIVNTVMAAGMAEMASLIEGGASHRDAVAQLYKESRGVIFTGNCYSGEWPEEAEQRGLANLSTTPLAAAAFNAPAAKELFSSMGVFTPQEVDARQEVMYENYNTTLGVEVQTLVRMMESDILPACAKDLGKYVIAIIFAVSMIFVKQEAFMNSAPLWKYLAISLSNVAASYCQYEALRYVSFPVQMLGKSFKMMPVMIWGIIISGKRYALGDWAVAAAVTGGVTEFLLTGTISAKHQHGTSVHGLVLLLLFLGLDGFTSTFQERLFKEHKTSKYNQMVYVNFFSGLVSFITLAATRKIGVAFSFCGDHPRFIADAFFLSASAVGGQWFIYSQVKEFGALVFAATMNLRQVISILVSYLTYKHPIAGFQIIGLALVFLGLFYKSYSGIMADKVKKDKETTPLLEKDAESPPAKTA